MSYSSPCSYIRFLIENSEKRQDKTSFWSEIIEAINEFSITHIYGQRSLRELCPLLVDALMTRSCEDKDLAVRIADCCARILDISRRNTWNSYQSCEVLFERDCEHEACRPEKKSTGAFWVLVPLRSSDVSQCVYFGPSASCGADELVRVALKAGDWKFLSMLVRYGFWNGSEDLMHWSELLTFWVRIRSYFGLHQTYPQIHKCARELCKKLQENGGRLVRYHERGFRRIPLIIRTLRAVMYHKEHKPTADQYVKCITTYFAAVPDPLVSENEALEFLVYILGEREEEEDCIQAIDQFLGKWVDLFGQQRYMPRRLTHLCRSTVRNVLMQNKSRLLLSMVKVLPVPDAIQEFILGTPVLSVR